MLTIMFLATFTATGLCLHMLFQILSGRRRAREVLRWRDPTEQRATVVRSYSLFVQGEQIFRQAGLSWSFQSYLWLCLAVLLASGLLVFTGALAMAAVVLPVFCVGPWVLIRHRRAVRAEQIEKQLPAALTLAANTIRAGGTLLQAVAAVAKQMPDPIGGEFVRIQQALKLQVSIGDALEEASKRIGARHFTAVVIACKVAAQAGADLDVLLESISRETVEDRQFQEGMKAASSEGRTSAKVVTVIPILGGLFFLIKDPAYFRPMLDSPMGRTLLFGSMCAVVIGWVVIKRIVDVRSW